MRSHKIAVIHGDGIGPEVIEAARKVLDAAAEAFGLTVEMTDYTLGARHYQQTGKLWSDRLADELRQHDAILFGAMGDPAVPPGVLERGIILRMRLAFQQSVNLRPVRLYPGVPSPIRDLTPERCDLVIIRENTEGAYVDEGTILHGGTRDAVAVQNSVNTRHGVERVVDYAFRLAELRRRRLTLCHKKNILLAAGGLWQDTVDDLAARYPDVEVDYVHVDAMCFHLPTNPERFDVVVTDNLFGDIVTDLGAVIQGGLGVAASANLNIDGSAPSMFEAIHGSAPDIAGKGWAILSAAMCLATLGESEAAKAIEAAVVEVLTSLPATSGPAMAHPTQEIGLLVAESVAQPKGHVDAASVLDALAQLRPGTAMHGAQAGRLEAIT